MKPMQRQQRGITAVLVVIGLLALLAMVGLAMDTGHVVLNKSRLQNTVDAAALAAAKVLDMTGSEAQATTAARSVFDLNAANQPELSSVLSGADITVQYSNTLSPFAPGSAPANYVRVYANNFDMWTSFTSLVGVDKTSTAATAVAGPSAPILPTATCDLFPVMICANMPGGTASNQFGGVLDPSIVTPLKISELSSSLPGGTGLVCLDDENCGGREVGEWLAGAGTCDTDDGWLVPKPGTVTGPTDKGIGTRFTSTGNMPYDKLDFPPDLFTTQPTPKLTMAKGDPVHVYKCADATCKNPGELVDSIDDVSYTYADYKNDQLESDFTPDIPGWGRRVVATPVVDCTTYTAPRSTVKILGAACFFLLQEIIQVPGDPAFVLGQYTNEGCIADGAAGQAPGPEAAPFIYKIVLHNDPASPDS